jgi:nucleoside-diphosphate-sugar epimerase
MTEYIFRAVVLVGFLPLSAIFFKVVVAGATGQTGSRILSLLREKYPDIDAVAGVRSVKKSNLSNAVPLDVTDSSTFAPALAGVDALICAVGFVPGNPFQMSAAAHAVDNVGSIALFDAAKAAGVKKIILVSSILTVWRTVVLRGAPHSH